jgi:hypothetical protein
VNDILWSVFSLYAFILVSLPVYFNTVNVITDHDIACEQRTQPDKVVFSELFKTVYNGVFSDYKISLLSKTPLVIQVLAGGSVLYSIFGLDWVMHSLAGFGIGAVSLKAYKTAVNTYSYSKLASYFGLDKFESFKTERKWATAEWTIFCLVIVTVSWELVERIIYFIQPTNVFRIGLEFVGNSFGDVVFGILGGMIAWQLIENKLHWD